MNRWQKVLGITTLTAVLLPYAPEMKNAIPGARLEIVRGQGHELPLADPAEANRIMLAFLRQ